LAFMERIDKYLPIRFRGVALDGQFDGDSVT
jgi:hypothetical protein